MIKAIVNEEKEWTITRSEDNGLIVNDQPVALDTVEKPGNVFHIIRDARSYVVELVHYIPEEKRCVLLVNGNKYHVQLKDDRDLLLESMGLQSLAQTGELELQAPMPGMVLQVLVKEGDTLCKGDPMLVLEAMKMENVLKAPADVAVKSVEVTEGTAVEKNQVLVHFE